MTCFCRIFSLTAATLLASATPTWARTPVGPQPLGNPGQWITTSDYPPEALRSLSEGQVVFRLRIGVTGLPEACEIVASSRWPILDEATCRLLSQRALFSPAIDQQGRVAVGFYRNAVLWRIPEDLPDLAKSGAVDAAPARP